MKHRIKRFATTLALVASAVPALAQNAERPTRWHGLTAEELAEAFTPESVRAGVRITREECARTKLAVWVEHDLGTECIRYFPSPGVSGARRVVFFFHGDAAEALRRSPSARPTTARAKLNEALSLERVNGVPFVLVSRPGVFGSSGDHTQRRRPKEFRSLNAAVDAIKAKYGIAEVILAGQSGGATSVGALLTLGRTDVTCAVATSGGYDVLGRAKEVYRTKHLGRWGCDTTLYCDPYNVTDFTSGVASAPSRRIFVIGDPRDANTPFSFQKAFAEKLRQAGHDAVLVEAGGTGPDHHGLAHMATRTAGWCNAGLATDAIVQKIHDGEYGLHDVRRKLEPPANPDAASD